MMEEYEKKEFATAEKQEENPASRALCVHEAGVKAKERAMGKAEKTGHEAYISQIHTPSQPGMFHNSV